MARPGDSMDPELLRCRFYRETYPKADDVVVVHVREVAEMGAYVSLMEYNDIEGMILLSELSRRRIRSINRLIRAGKTEVVTVLRVDKEKGYIDLSKRRVSPEDIAACEERYAKSKTVHNILRHVCKLHRMPLEELYKSVGWPLYDKFGHAHDAFKMAVSDPDTVLEGLEIADDVRETLLENVRRRLTPHALKIRADIELTCFTYEGIDAIRESLMEGKKESTPEIPITIKLVAPPRYVVHTTTLMKRAGIEALNRALAAITEAITARGGSINIKMAPRATSQRDDSELSSMMERMEMENREVDGDTPDGEEEEE
eukprot:PLAT11627.1.p2 GENE.PLAT11627.1~~PLAT11627.1.p2  ORF type:complete len:315 (+),score=164.19 PLAT11627.1:742-1686(+)